MEYNVSIASIGQFFKLFLKKNIEIINEHATESKSITALYDKQSSYRYHLCEQKNYSKRIRAKNTSAR